MLRTFLIVALLSIAANLAHAGLARVPLNNSATLVVYAAKPGTVSMDGEGRNSLFTTSLLKVLSESEEEITSTVSAITREVYKASNGHQTPWWEYSLAKPFYFSKPSSETRTALVIGNSSYKTAHLINPINDAKDISSLLRKQGFSVSLRIDVTHSSMSRAISSYINSLSRNSVGVFYFSGHGVQLHGKNYILPIDVNADNATNLRYSAIQLEEIIELMARADNYLNILFLDASRTNPFGIGREYKPPSAIEIKPSKVASLRKTETELNFAINSILSHLYTSNIEMLLPEKARIGEPHNVSIALRSNDAIDVKAESERLEESIRRLRVQGGDTINFSSSLVTTINGNGFKVTEITPREQLANPYDTTKWKWMIEPVAAGDSKLHVTINAVFTVNGRVLHKSIFLEEKSLHVDTNFMKNIFDFIANNWAYLLSSIIIPLFVWWWKARRKTAVASS